MGIAGTVPVAGHRGPATLVALLVIVGLSFGGSGVSAGDRPKVIALPERFQPEGIATRDGNSFFVGSIPTGAIYRGNLRTGEGSIFVPAQEGRQAIGLSLRTDMLFVAGGPTGQAYVYDAGTGAELAMFQLTTDDTFVNDVVATEDAAYFTDSVNQRLYKVPIEGPGRLGTPETLPLTGISSLKRASTQTGSTPPRTGRRSSSCRATPAASSPLTRRPEEPR